MGRKRCRKHSQAGNDYTIKFPDAQKILTTILTINTSYSAGLGEAVRGISIPGSLAPGGARYREANVQQRLLPVGTTWRTFHGVQPARLNVA